MLAEFDFEVEFIPGKENSPADVLSRLPEPRTERTEEKDYGRKIALTRIKDVSISKRVLKSRILEDQQLSKVVQYLKSTWPARSNLSEDLHTYWEKKDELSYEEEILLWRGRLVIPASLQENVLFILHEGHPGASAMRSVARLNVWWPSMERRIENFLKSCKACQENRPWDQESPLYSWNVPTEVWSRVHVDFAEAFEGQYWLIIVDATSKWLEVFPMRSITAERTVAILLDVFARWGFPRVVVSDNGPQWIAQTFKDFCARNNVRHVTTTPYHPRTNGLAERAVRTFKERFASSRREGEDSHTRLCRFLMSYRAAVQRTTGRTPAELMTGRQLRTKLTLLKPDLASRVEENLFKQKMYHDKGSGTVKEFAEGETVWVKRKREEKTFKEGVIKKRTGPLSYVVILEGVERRVHADQLRKAEERRIGGGGMLDP